MTDRQRHAAGEPRFWLVLDASWPRALLASLALAWLQLLLLLRAFPGFFADRNAVGARHAVAPEGVSRRYFAEDAVAFVGRRHGVGARFGAADRHAVAQPLVGIGSRAAPSTPFRARQLLPDLGRSATTGAIVFSGAVMPVTSMSRVAPAWFVYSPNATHEPNAGHCTSPKITPGLVPAFTGAAISLRPTPQPTRPFETIASRLPPSFVYAPTRTHEPDAAQAG